MVKGDRQKKAVADLVTREYTVNLNKRLHGITFKKRAPRAVRELRKFAEQTMKTKDVRLDTKLNKYLWSKGVRNVPFRVRVRLARKRNEDEEADEKVSQRGSIVVVGSQRRTENGRHGGVRGRPRVRDRTHGSRDGSSCEKSCFFFVRGREPLQQACETVLEYGVKDALLASRPPSTCTVEYRPASVYTEISRVPLSPVVCRRTRRSLRYVARSCTRSSPTARSTRSRASRPRSSTHRCASSLDASGRRPSFVNLSFRFHIHCAKARWSSTTRAPQSALGLCLASEETNRLNGHGHICRVSKRNRKTFFLLFLVHFRAGQGFMQVRNLPWPRKERRAGEKP